MKSQGNFTQALTFTLEFHDETEILSFETQVKASPGELYFRTFIPEKNSSASAGL